MKKILSLFLVLLLLMSNVTVVFGAGFGGAGTWNGVKEVKFVSSSGGTSMPQSSGIKTEQSYYLRGGFMMRLKAFPVEAGRLEQEYFSYTTSPMVIYNYDPQTLMQRTSSYETTQGWVYFYGGGSVVKYPNPRTAFGKEGYPDYSVQHMFRDGHVETAIGHLWNSPTMNEFVELCGGTAGSNVCDYNVLNRLLRSDAALNNKVAVGQFLGLTEEQANGNYYIVAEQVILNAMYYINSKGVQEWLEGMLYIDLEDGPTLGLGEERLGMTYATLQTDTAYTTSGRPWMYGSENELLGTKLKVGKASNWITAINSTYKCLQDANHAPWENLGFTMGNPINNGYVLYGFGDLVGGVAGGNVAVEYQGDVNTSDSAKFVSTGTLNNKGTNTDLSYYDFTSGKFVDASEDAVVLQFADKIDTSEEYALCFTGDAGYTIQSDDIKITSQMKSAFEDAPGQNFSSNSLLWGKYLANTGSYNIGYTWRVATLDGYTSTASIEQKFESAFNAASTGGSLSSAIDRHETSDQYRDMPVMAGSMEVARDGFSHSSDKVLETNPDGSYKLVKDETFGMGYEFIIRGTPVTSRKITFKLDGESDAATRQLTSLYVDSSETWREDYTTARAVACAAQNQPDYTFALWIAVPDMDDSITSSIDGALNSLTSLTVADIRNAVCSVVPSSLIQGMGTSEMSIGLGSTLDEPPVGYTVYEILFKNNIPTVPTVGTVILPAYMLNRYFDNIIQTSSQLAGTPTKFTLAKEWTWTNWKSPVYCCNYGTFLGWASYDTDWVIEYYDSASSHEFGLDNSMIDRYYPRGTGTWSSSVRSKLTHAWQESMDTKYMPNNTYVIDYAFNLIRGNNDFGDKRSVSGISYQNYVAGTNDGDNLLKISSQFGVKPAVVKNAAQSRKTDAALATYTEQFSIESRYAFWSDKVGQYVNPMESHSCTRVYYCGSEHCGGHISYCFHSYYTSTYDHTCLGFYGLREGNVNTINYQFTNTAYKYTTKNDLGTGKNDFLGGANSKPLSAGKRNSTAGSITDSNFYRFTTVRYTGVDLKFHPENLMVFKIGGTEFSAINAMPYEMTNVISEVKRTSASSGMYFFRLNGNITDVPGTVYSDSMQGGTGMMGFSSAVSIPAGADVTIAADPTGVSVDLYGYDLDLVQVDDDGKLGAVGESRAYNTVVKSGLNAYNEWGNSTSHADMLRHFNSWCDDILKVENYAADFKLYVNGGLKSENFSATVGHVERGSAGTVEEGVYQLVVRKGILQTGEGDYTKMLQQMATDYGCSTSEAEAMFQESKIYTAIINGMETCLNPKNNSKTVFEGLTYTPDILGTWTDQLGGNGNWYDETSQTFVVRRFTNLGNKLCDVIAEDKIDYQLAPTAGTGTGENAYSSLSYTANWELNIFFDQNHSTQVNDLLLGSATYYDPQNGSTGFDPSNNAYSVLFNSIPVNGADFVIPASSTQDFRN